MSLVEVAGAGLCLNPERAAQVEAAVTGRAIERPETPPHIKKFRQSFRKATGVRFNSVGLADQPLPPEDTRFGRRTDMGTRVGDCLDVEPASELGGFLLDQREARYKSRIKEPLGRTMSRGHVLPPFVNSDDFRHGRKTTSSVSAKNLMYYTDSEFASRELPVSTQESDIRPITRPVDREYKWPGHIDPNTHVFGKVEKDRDVHVDALLKHDTDTKIVPQRVERIQALNNAPLGRTRNAKGALRHLPEDFVFGKTIPTDPMGARALIHGAYAPEQQLPDKDLGVNTRKLSKLPHLPPMGDRTFGLPTIRDDIPRPRMRSVADSQNYGNESSGKALLYPSPFAPGGVSDDEFLRERTPAEIREVFAKMGSEFADDEFDRHCDRAVSDFGVLSIDSFRHAWNKARLESRPPSATVLPLAPSLRSTAFLPARAR